MQNIVSVKVLSGHMMSFGDLSGSNSMQPLKLAVKSLLLS